MRVMQEKFLYLSKIVTHNKVEVNGTVASGRFRIRGRLLKYTDDDDDNIDL